MKKILIIVAHPDDEILGCAGLVFSEQKKGSEINLLILSKSVGVRENKPIDKLLLDDINKSSKIIGIKNIFFGDFKNIEFNLIPHVVIVKFIENIILKVNPDIVITHHPSDLNNDHQITSYACQVASKIYQRKSLKSPISKILFMEVLSSTEWNINPNKLPFFANYFYEIDLEAVKSKIEALKSYRGVVRKYPHPRSKDIIISQLKMRGSQIGKFYAEAFQVGIIIDNL